MTDVKMPKPVIRDMEPYCEPTGFTEAQMKQYGDDRERAGATARLAPLSVTARNGINVEMIVRRGFGGPDVGYLIDLVIDAVEKAHNIRNSTEEPND